MTRRSGYGGDVAEFTLKNESLTLAILRRQQGGTASMMDPAALAVSDLAPKHHIPSRQYKLKYSTLDNMVDYKTAMKVPHTATAS